MSQQRILKEAQEIASEYSFWMESGNISHLYGFVVKVPEKSYELEIKFGDDFPNSPPELIFHDKIKELLGEIELSTLDSWSNDSSVIEIIDELNSKIKSALSSDTISEQQQKTEERQHLQQTSTTESNDSEEYITPDLNAYPPDFQTESEPSYSGSGDDLFYTEEESGSNESIPATSNNAKDVNLPEHAVTSPDELFADSDSSSVQFMTELGLIQQEYAFDQKGDHKADIVVYMTITLTKTFLIRIDFSKYPQKPILDLPENAKKIIEDPNRSLDTLKNWDEENPPHVVDVLHELEKELYSVKKIETQLQKISQEYQYTMLPNEMSKVRVSLLTYGFKEFQLELDLEPYPKVPAVNFLSDLRELVRINPNELRSVKEWKAGESEPLEILREVDWLVDKNSRINFELNLLNADYDDVEYDPLTTSLTVSMEGKMKTEDLMFEFKIDLPRDYPMSMPNIEVINEFEFDEQKAVKQELNESMADFFDEWTPYSYLVDLFNLVSKKIFEVSVVSCVICHDIDCPTCGLKIAGPDEDTCFISCPHCERSYHKHCWNETMNQYGKCGFCLKKPPTSYLP